MRVKATASKLRLTDDKYAMEVIFGDSTMQLEMTIHPDVIEGEIGETSSYAVISHGTLNGIKASISESILKQIVVCSLL